MPHGLQNLNCIVFFRVEISRAPLFGPTCKESLLIGFVCFDTAGHQEYLLWRRRGAKSIYSGAPPPPLTASNLLYRPRGTAWSARNYVVVPNLRQPRRGVVQTETMVLYIYIDCCDHTREKTTEYTSQQLLNT